MTLQQEVKIPQLLKAENKLDVEVHSFNPRTPEADAGGPL